MGMDEVLNTKKVMLSHAACLIWELAARDAREN